MITAKIKYEGALRTHCTHLQSGNSIITDAPTDNHGKGQAFSPTDLVATALGSCMLSIMGILANRQGWDIEGTEVAITKVMASEPRRIAKIVVQFTMPAKGYDEKTRAMLINAAKTCPVAYSLHPDIEQEVSFDWL